MSEHIPKVIRDGKVAVIVSPGHGAGWSTWCSDPDVAVFDPQVVRWIEDGKPGGTGQFYQVEPYRYTGGLDDAEIEWLPIGTPFYIEEYDGQETVRTPADWTIA